MHRLPLLAVLLLVGCNNVARTVPEAPPVVALPDGPAGARNPAAAHQPAVAPVYADDRALIYVAAVEALRDYVGHIVDQDQQAGTVHAFDKNAWTGYSDVYVTLVPVTAGTRVDVEVNCHAVEWASDREHQLLGNYLERLDRKMASVRSVRAALDQTAAGSGSTTSRP
jgi:hypothetical protein